MLEFTDSHIKQMKSYSAESKQAFLKSIGYTDMETQDKLFVGFRTFQIILSTENRSNRQFWLSETERWVKVCESNEIDHNVLTRWMRQHCAILRSEETIKKAQDLMWQFMSEDNYEKIAALIRLLERANYGQDGFTFLVEFSKFASRTRQVNRPNAVSTVSTLINGVAQFDYTLASGLLSRLKSKQEMEWSGKPEGTWFNGIDIIDIIIFPETLLSDRVISYMADIDSALAPIYNDRVLSLG